MTDKEKLDKLVVEIKGLRKEVKDNIAELGNSESERVGLFKDLDIYDNILSFIDSMQEEPISKDSEQAAANYENNMWKAGHPEDTYTSTDIIRAVKFGANWQKEQMIRQLENIVYRRYSLDGGSEQRNKDLIKLIQNWKCQDGV